MTKIEENNEKLETSEEVKPIEEKKPSQNPSNQKLGMVREQVKATAIVSSYIDNTLTFIEEKLSSVPKVDSPAIKTIATGLTKVYNEVISQLAQLESE